MYTSKPIDLVPDVDKALKLRVMDKLDPVLQELATEPERDLLRRLIVTLRGLRYGSVTLIVHEGRLVEIQKTEKMRTGSSKTREGDASSSGSGPGLGT